MSIHHISLPTGPSTFAAMRAFYLATLTPLGYKIYLEPSKTVLGLRNTSRSPDFWLHCATEDDADYPTVTEETRESRRGRVHLAFDAGSRREVDEWYANAVKAGGTPNGKPGVREMYSKDYYAAFVLDPLGNNVEAVYFAPLWLRAIKAAPWIVTGLAGGLLGVGAMVLAGRS